MDTYIKTPTGEKGPFTLGQLRSMWASGAITKNDEYRDEGLVEWYPLSDLRSELEEPVAPPVARPSFAAVRSGPRFSDGKMRFENPQNGHIEAAGSPGLWALLFGCFYFLSKGVWTHAVLSLLLALPTYGASWLIYPFFATQIVRSHYLRRGWKQISG